MESNQRKPSTANDGFFQPIPTIKSQFYDDISFQGVVQFFLPADVIALVAPELARFGDEVASKRIFDWITDAEKNVPYLRGAGRDAFGQRTSQLIVSEGWKNLQNFGIKNGIVAAGYERKYSESTRLVQLLNLHLWTGSCANVTCPSAMTDGAAKLLSTHLSSAELDSVTRRVFKDAFDRLTSRDPGKAWTSGQWMTERSGGSDVSGTETIATFSQFPEEASASDIPLGPWRIDGFKWFSSATDSSMAILLAQTPKGLSTFLAPMYRKSSYPDSVSQPVTELNGISIQRLKNKFGTKSLPTAELELSGMRAHLIGTEGQGIQEISTILDITRLYSAVSAVGYLGRGLAVAKSFAKVREVGAGKGKRVMLKDSPLHMNTLAKVASEYHSLMLFTFFGAWLLGISEHRPSQTPAERSAARTRLLPDDPSDVSLLLRILFPVLKASVCKRSIHALQECMEALGGVGYLDNVENESINVARLYRDCCVLSIWEGTTDVLASDMLRVLTGRTGSDVLKALDRWILKALNSEIIIPQFDHARRDIILIWRTLKQRFTEKDHEHLLPSARDTLFKIADVVMGVLLVVDAASDRNNTRMGACLRYLKEHSLNGDEVLADERNLEGGLEMNQKIVFGEDIGTSSTVQPKL